MLRSTLPRAAVITAAIVVASCSGAGNPKSLDELFSSMGGRCSKETNGPFKDYTSCVVRFLGSGSEPEGLTLRIFQGEDKEFGVIVQGLQLEIAAPQAANSEKLNEVYEQAAKLAKVEGKGALYDKFGSIKQIIEYCLNNGEVGQSGDHTACAIPDKGNDIRKLGEHFELQYLNIREASAGSPPVGDSIRMMWGLSTKLSP